MIFKHNKNISRNFIASLICALFVNGCGGGGGGSTPQANTLTFSVTGLPSSVQSYENVAIQVIPSIEGCKFEILGPDLLWLSTSDDLNFNFRAPIIYGESKEFSFGIRTANTTVKPECAGSQNFAFNVTRSKTEFIPNPEPSNIPYLSSSYFSAHDIGFGGIEITDRYSATVCYPTENDCVTYENELFGQDAHNIATGDFNGDGFEDFVVAWAIFPHTIDQSKKIY